MDFHNSCNTKFTLKYGSPQQYFFLYFRVCSLAFSSLFVFPSVFFIFSLPFFCMSQFFILGTQEMPNKAGCWLIGLFTEWEEIQKYLLNCDYTNSPSLMEVDCIHFIGTYKLRKFEVSVLWANFVHDPPTFNVSHSSTFPSIVSIFKAKVSSSQKYKKESDHDNTPSRHRPRRKKLNNWNFKSFICISSWRKKQCILKSKLYDSTTWGSVR